MSLRSFKSLDATRCDDAKPTPSDDEGAESFLELLVARGRRGSFSDKFAVTPAFARALLRTNPENRFHKNTLVSSILAEIKAGGWHFNGETVIVSVEGLLNDGQNRLYAIEQSGFTCVTFIAFGLTRDSRMSVDSLQANRTTSDCLQMKGVANSGSVAALARHVIRFEKIGSFSTSKFMGRDFRTADVVAFSEKNLERLNYSINAVDKLKSKGVAHYNTLRSLHNILLKTSSTDSVDEFFRSLISGSNLPETNPILILKNRLSNERFNKSFTADAAAELTFRAWNHVRLGTTLTKYQVKNEIPLPIATGCPNVWLTRAQLEDQGD